MQHGPLFSRVSASRVVLAHNNTTRESWKTTFPFFPLQIANLPSPRSPFRLHRLSRSIPIFVDCLEQRAPRVTFKRAVESLCCGLPHTSRHELERGRRTTGFTPFAEAHHVTTCRRLSSLHVTSNGLDLEDSRDAPGRVTPTLTYIAPSPPLLAACLLASLRSVDSETHPHSSVNTHGQNPAYHYRLP